MSKVHWNLYGILVMLVLICVRVDGVSGPGEGGGDGDVTTAAGDNPATNAPGPEPKCSNEGQLCGRVKLGQTIAAFDIYITAGFYVDCCPEFECEPKFQIAKSDGGICKKKGGEISCVGHHMPCGSVNGVTLKCCDNLGVTCDDSVKYNIKELSINVGYCKTGEEKTGCMAIGMPCGSFNKDNEIKCCDGVNCDTKSIQVLTGSFNLKGGFCKPKDGARAAEKTDTYNAGGDSTKGPSDTATPSGGTDIKPGQIGIIIFSLAWFFT